MQNERVARLLVRSPALRCSRSPSARRSRGAPPPKDPGHDLPLTLLLRIDFAARVRTGDGGERQVLIEIQKASAPRL